MTVAINMASAEWIHCTSDGEYITMCVWVGGEYGTESEAVCKVAEDGGLGLRLHQMWDLPLDATVLGQSVGDVCEGFFYQMTILNIWHIAKLQLLISQFYMNVRFFEKCWIFVIEQMTFFIRE